MHVVNQAMQVVVKTALNVVRIHNMRKSKELTLYALRGLEGRVQPLIQCVEHSAEEDLWPKDEG